MASVTNLQNSVVTGGKFVAISSNSLSMRERLRNLQTSVSSSLSEIDLEAIRGIVEDNVITPIEKKSLKDRWDSISSGYLRLLANISDAFGSSELQSLEGIQIVYERLYSKMERILADLSTETNVEDDFEADIQEFITRYSDISQLYSRAIFDIQKYAVVLFPDKTSYEDGDTVNVTAILMYNGIQKEIDYSTAGLVWNVEGVPEASCTKRNNVLTFPASAFTGSVRIDCSMEIPISTP